MSEYTHLIGAEDVRRAGSMMQAAAEQMSRAATSFEESLARHRSFMEDWLTRFQQTLKRLGEEGD